MDQVFDYLLERQADRFEPLRFGFWKRIIKYKTGLPTYEVRKIFMKLIDKGCFSKIRVNNKHFKYKFIPYGEKEEVQEKKLIW
tara:strand:+ start:406 stop:654 length:249 start_codon:yes stop_codon:yes gene_type:complete